MFKYHKTCQRFCTKHAKDSAQNELLICNDCCEGKNISVSDERKMLRHVMNLYNLDWSEIYKTSTGIREGCSKYIHMKETHGWKSDMSDDESDEN